VQGRPSRRLSQLIYGVAALAALGAGTLLALYTRGETLRPAPASRPGPLPSSPRSQGQETPSGTGPVTLHSKNIRVEVLNGCGEAGVMDPFIRSLRASGFDVIKTGNARSFAYLESMVLDRGGRREVADEVAGALGIRTVIQQVKDDPFRIEDVTVIIGRDHRKLSLE
jgi:hypothetical protein